MTTHETSPPLDAGVTSEQARAFDELTQEIFAANGGRNATRPMDRQRLLNRAHEAAWFRIMSGLDDEALARRTSFDRSTDDA